MVKYQQIPSNFINAVSPQASHCLRLFAPEKPYFRAELTPDKLLLATSPAPNYVNWELARDLPVSFWDWLIPPSSFVV
jgi:hypothetical protein